MSLPLFTVIYNTVLYCTALYRAVLQPEFVDIIRAAQISAPV